MTVSVLIPGREDRLPRYAAAIRRQGGCPRFGASGGDCAGLLLPGGGDLDPALYGQPDRGSHPGDLRHDRLELALAREFLAAGKPVLGICRGLQVVNVALGGTLVQDLPGHSQQAGADRVHPVTAVVGSLAAALWGRRFWVNSAHHQAAARPGTGLRVTARADDGTVEALEGEWLPVWAFQWHPERMAPPLLPDGGPLFAFFLGKCREKLEETP